MLVTTGYPHENGGISEVIDLNDPTFTCNGILNFPFPLHDAVGGIVQNIPLVCSNTCWTLQPNGAWKEEQNLTLTMETQATASGSVVMNDELVVVQGPTVQLVSPKNGTRTLSARSQWGKNPFFIHFLQNSHYQRLIFRKIHILKISFFHKIHIYGLYFA